jgi:GNAT superfamily N-acetyltransferase
MTQTLTAPPSLQGVIIRPYRPSDHNACRRLWGELARHQASLFGAGSDVDAQQGHDASAGFEEYLTQLNLSGMWVAEHVELGVAGFVGMMLDGRNGEVEPVVVTQALRGRGIGRALVAKVAEEARRRGLARLTISPSIRDAAALHSLHAAGFDRLDTVKLSYDLSGQRADSGQTLDLHRLRFSL